MLHDSSEFRFLYSAVECVTAHASVAFKRTWELKLSSVLDEWSTVLGNTTVYVGVNIFALSFLSEC